ncbi:UNVERIFIED_CONTAM: hypothetical protein Sindi_1422600 [Sesamum indicum]
MKIEFLSQKVNEIPKILPDLHKGLTDLKVEITDLKRKQRESPETSRFRQERIKDALGTIYQIYKELAESFSQLEIVDLVNIQTNEITPALPPRREAKRKSRKKSKKSVGEYTLGKDHAPALTFIWRYTKPGHYRFSKYREIDRRMGCNNQDSNNYPRAQQNKFIKLVELSLEVSVKIGWDNTPEDTKASILVGDSKGAIADRLGRLINLHFIGDGYLKGSRAQKAREYVQALFSLKLRSICAVDEYIYWFHKYFFQSEVATESYKVPKGQLDSVEQKMSFLKDKLKNWCHQASIQKNMKRLRGESSEPRKRRKQNSDSYPRSSRRTFPDGDHGGPSPKSEHINRDREQDQQGLHPRDPDEQMQDPPKEPLQEELSEAHTRANECFKYCNCWTCGAKGHISPDCPQKRGELRKFEATDDILDAVYYGNLVLIYQFEDLPSNESVYEEKIETDSDGSSTESE